MNKKDHISVSICTFKRPGLLQNLLIKLQDMETEQLFTYSVVVIDNDVNRTAEDVVASVKKISRIDISYYNVPEPSFSLARNRAIEASVGEYLAFIDDDEYPVPDWLLDHYKNIKKYGVVAVLGPVIPDYETDPPKWLLKSKLSERNRFVTGTYLDLIDTRTGNVLIDISVFKDKSNFFNLDYGKLGGEDVAFFTNLKEKGHKFIWCDEAAVYEFVPVNRMTIRYHVQRAVLRGYTSYKRVKNDFGFIQKFKMFVKSSLAVNIYIVLMPLLLITGFHNYIKYRIRLTEHFIRILTMFNLFKLKERKF